MDYQQRAKSLVEQTKAAAQMYCERNGLIGVDAFRHLVGRLEGLVLAMAQESSDIQEKLDDADGFIKSRDLWDDFRDYCGYDALGDDIDCLDDFRAQERQFNRDGMGAM